MSYFEYSLIAFYVNFLRFSTDSLKNSGRLNIILPATSIGTASLAEGKRCKAQDGVPNSKTHGFQ